MKWPKLSLACVHSSSRKPHLKAWEFCLLKESLDLVLVNLGNSSLLFLFPGSWECEQILHQHLVIFQHNLRSMPASLNSALGGWSWVVQPLQSWCQSCNRREAAEKLLEPWREHSILTTRAYGCKNNSQRWKYPEQRVPGAVFKQLNKTTEETSPSDEKFAHVHQ